MAAPQRKPLAKGMEAERVVERMKADKSLEALEREALQRLKDDPKFNAEVQEMVASSSAVRRKYQGAELNHKLRVELEEKVLEKAMVRLWELLNSREDGVAIAAEARVNAALTEVLADHAASAAGRQKPGDPVLSLQEK